ncbi:MAG: lytic transglycosylase domain-containing protein [Bdellovibrionales bacterium]|nr:lytic transglycosylase domain-containing protein [Bdellovibrionales bacterium]
MNIVTNICVKLCLIVISLCFIELAHAEIYQVQDDQGNIRYTDSPPLETQYTVYTPKEGPILKHHGSGYYVSEEYQRLSMHEIHNLADQVGQKYGIDASLIKAVIRTESDYDVRATSHKGAMGLMQLMPETARYLGVDNAYNAAQNIDGGVRHLRSLLEKYQGRVEMALAAYNAGESAVQKYNGIPPFPETQQYVKKVKKYYSLFTGSQLQLASAQTLP